MRYRLRWHVLVMLVFIAVRGFGQVGEKVVPVKVLNMDNQSVSLPLLGQKNLLIFYADPNHPKQNEAFREYMKSHPVHGEIDSYGVVNMGAAPLIPVSVIRKRVRKELKGTDGQVYLDPDKALSTAWKLPGANHNFTIIFVNKDCVIEFYKAGQLTAEEQQQVLRLIEKYK